MEYSFPYWVFFFFIYCFLGWCVESAIVSIDTKKLTNRGFLRGPALPIYGFGAILIVFSTMPFKNSIALTYIVGAVACTALEYVTGVLMEAIFKTRYWDYTGKFMNFQGRICLISSLFWGVLSVFVARVIHRPIAEFVFDKISFAAVLAMDIVFGAIMIADLCFSVRAAFKLSEIVGKLEEVNVQLELAKMEVRDALSLKAVDLERQMDEVMERLGDRNDELRRRIAELRQSRENIFAKAGFTVRSMVKDNPTARHKRFAEGYKELKEYILEKKIKNGEN